MAHVIAFVYDITNPKSYSVAQDWVNKVALENCCVYYLVGNKVNFDLMIPPFDKFLLSLFFFPV